MVPNLKCLCCSDPDFGTRMKLYVSVIAQKDNVDLETKTKINQDAVRLMKQLYGIDMELTQYSKTIDKIPTPDIAISMGCDVGCPYIGRAFDYNWGHK